MTRANVFKLCATCSLISIYFKNPRKLAIRPLQLYVGLKYILQINCMQIHRILSQSYVIKCENYITVAYGCILRYE